MVLYTYHHPTLLPFTAVLTVIACFCLFGALLSAARLLHSHLMSNVIRLPMSFFDTTPLGRTINRFSKDVDTLDNTMPLVISDGAATLACVLATIFAISYATPIFLAVVGPVAVVYNLARVSVHSVSVCSWFCACVVGVCVGGYTVKYGANYNDTS